MFFRNFFYVGSIFFFFFFFSRVCHRVFKNSRSFVLLSCRERPVPQKLSFFLVSDRRHRRGFAVTERNFFVSNSRSPVSFRETGISSAGVLWVSRNEFRIVPVCYSIVRVHKRAHPWAQLFHFNRISSFVRLFPFPHATFSNFFSRLSRRRFSFVVLFSLSSCSTIQPMPSSLFLFSFLFYLRTPEDEKKYRVGVVDRWFVQFFDDLFD